LEPVETGVSHNPDKNKGFQIDVFPGRGLKRGCGKLSTGGINLLEH
jgi:hypothetical protein